MTWNYRVLRRVSASSEAYFAIHEVYYREDGTPHSCSMDSISAVGASQEELAADFALMAKALSLPHIEYSYFDKLEAEAAEEWGPGDVNGVYKTVSKAEKEG